MGPEVPDQSGVSRARVLKLEELKWDNTFVRELPGDKERGGIKREVHGALFSYVQPTLKIRKPFMIAFSEDVAENVLGLDPAE
jgi:hypothetical protein